MRWPGAAAAAIGGLGLAGCVPAGVPAGEVLWAVAVDGGVASRPAVADGVVYASGEDGTFYAVDAASGTVLWTRDTGGGPASPAVADGVVYVGGADRIWALDASGGGERWMLGVGQPCEGAAAVADGVAYVGCSDGVLYAVDTFHGGLHWRFATGGPVVGRPAAAEGVLVFGAWDGVLYAVDLQATEADYEALGGLTEVDPVLAWSRPLGDFVSASPVAAQGRVWVGVEHESVTPDDDILYALDLATGAVAWSDGSLVGVHVYAGAVLRDGSLWVATENWYDDGRPDYAFRVDAGTGLERWSHELRGSVLGDPALSGDGAALYVQTVEDGLHVLDAASGELLWTRPGTGGSSGVAVADGVAFLGVADEGLQAVAAPAE